MRNSSTRCFTCNETPHERLFSFQRRSSSGYSVPSIIADNSKVLIRQHVKHSKQDPFVQEAELISTNPKCGRVHFLDGRETTVSLRDVSPCPDEIPQKADKDPSVLDDGKIDTSNDAAPDRDASGNSLSDFEEPNESLSSEQPDQHLPRRSTRIRKTPDRFGY